jgi:colanic acid/amylovoran biosynthesis glycosyltransferase
VRLAYVLERYPELTQTFVEAELRELARAGDAVDVLALGPGDGAELAEPRFEPRYPPRGAARVAALAETLARGRRGAAAFLRRRAASTAGAVADRWPPDGARLRGVARVSGWRGAAAEADHLHAHFATEAADIAALLGALGGTPHSFTGHSTDLFAQPEHLPARLDAAAFAVVVCDYDRREVDRIAPGRGTLHVVPLGLDLDAIRRTTPYDPDGPVVAVGRLVEHKGFADLAAIAASVGRRVVIAGDGPQRAELERLAGGAVDFRGPLSAADSRTLIESASVLVAPSVIARDGSRDGIPMVIKEALALATPVLVSDAVGNPEVINEEHGRLHRAGDRQELADVLRQMLERDDREAMGRTARAFAEEHADVRKQTAKLRDLFRPR